MKKRILSIIGIAIFLLSVMPGKFISKVSAQSARNIIDTTIVVFLLDGKKIPAHLAFEMMQNYEITMRGANIPKQAIKYYGEKYRNGVYFCIPVQDENNEKNEK